MCVKLLVSENFAYTANSNIYKFESFIIDQVYVTARSTKKKNNKKPHSSKAI